MQYISVEKYLLQARFTSLGVASNNNRIQSQLFMHKEKRYLQNALNILADPYLTFTNNKLEKLFTKA